MDLLLQFLALVILAGGIALAYWLFVRRFHAQMGLQETGAMLLVLLGMVGGFVGAPFWWLDEARAFSWDLPPLGARMLGAAGWSFAIVGFLTLRRPTFGRLRLFMLMLFVYLAPLAAVIFLFHLNRFDLRAGITYSFFAIAILMTVSSAWYLFVPRRVLPDEPRDRQPAPPALRIWLALVALITALWGVALFITDNGPSALIWVWPGDLLTSRLIGTMLLTIAAGAAYALRKADLARVMLAPLITYSLGLAVASLWNLVAGKPIKPAYLVVFGVIFVVSAVLLAVTGRRRQ